MTAVAQPYQATCVMRGGRALLIEGPPGAGKSSLALAMIDRGAVLIGDDGVLLTVAGERLLARPHPNIVGRLEVRNLGLLDFPTCAEAPVALVVRLDASAPRFLAVCEHIRLCGIELPFVRLWPEASVLAVKAELALERYGLA